MVSVNGESLCALVDTGCSKSIVKSTVALQYIDRSMTPMVAFDGRPVDCSGTAIVQVGLAGRWLSVQMVVADAILEGIDMIIGMDVINMVGSVQVGGGKVEFSTGEVCAAMETQKQMEHQGAEHKIEDADFLAWFDGSKWFAQWKWKSGTPPKLTNRTPLYNKVLTKARRQGFEEEVERWIAEGILVPWEGDDGLGILALMPVVQETKEKTRPVLDFREVNKSVECHTGSELLDVCTDKLREWRMTEGDVEILDLKSAYLQIHVPKELWRYQLVKYKGVTYCLTRLGFGLSSAPKIMSGILKYVLRMEKAIEGATSSFIDDILVSQSKVSSEVVAAHLLRYGLVTKPAEQLEGGAALGLKIERDRDGELLFTRGNQIPKMVEGSLTKRELFSLCGKLVGHYPIAGWLRLACSYIKRKAGGENWDDVVDPVACQLISEVLERVAVEDPVRGKWRVFQGQSGVVWTDASNLALGILVEVDGTAVEDAAWLRKSSDHSHINVAELDAVLKGVNLAIKWGLTDLSVMIDSATVYRWIHLTLTGERRVKTKGAEEIVIKRRLGALKTLVEELGLKVQVTLIPSGKNKADILTRVKKNWLVNEVKEQEYHCLTAVAMDIKKSHGQHHMGVDRTLFAARQVDPSVTREEVMKVVKSCERCQSIDPAPVSHSPGVLSVLEPWTRIAIDVTHYKAVPYLSIVDCGPGRYAIWRELRRETAQSIIEELAEIFRERGPVSEVLMDNATVFRSGMCQEFFQGWNIRSWFRAAHRASGNGIVERHHRTIKAMAERATISPLVAVFWYNFTPRQGQKDGSVPYKSLFSYTWRHPDVDPPEHGTPECTLRVGEEVWVKPPDAKCTSQWGRGVVTEVNSNNNVSINGMPRHVLDLRRVTVGSEDDSSSDEAYDDAIGVDGVESVSSPVEEAPTRRYPARERRPPRRLVEE